MKKLILLLIIIISTTIYSQVNVERSTEKTVINAKEYIVHRVKKGQTPYSISRAYGMPIKTLMLANDKLAKEFVLTIDQKLLIPIDQLDTKPNTSNLFKTKKVVQKDHSRYIYHTVKKGEWAHKIARDYNISFKVLTENNPNLDMINLKLGDEVKIPKTTSTKRKIFVSDDGMIIKTIVDGDTYKSIAAEYNIEESVLREYNAVDELLPGTVIRIPNEERGVATPKYKSYEYYTVKPKETLYRISKKFQIELKLLMRINNIKEDFIIKEGQVLKIPKIDIDKSTSQIQEKKWYEEDNQIEMKESDDPFGETGETIFVKHLVKKGETPYSISKTHGIPIQLLYDYNPESKNIISIGQTLRIPVDGVELNEQIDEIIFNKNNIAKKEESKKKNCSIFTCRG
jgi:LysM repeat protein